jgi:uncharacterized protein YqjF (DUF2071 family)
MKTFLKAEWENIIMANYEIDPSLLIPYLPKGTELDYFNGKTYVSLVGFLFKDTAIFGIPIPFLGTFEEVNLRFYVTRKVEEVNKRGVVFINETVPNKLVAFVANKLYKEHYSAVPTKHIIKENENRMTLNYLWKVQNNWNYIEVEVEGGSRTMEKNTIEEFIYEHYYGYTKIDHDRSLEYKINHPSWKTKKVTKYKIQCDFADFYGENFRFLNDTKPHSVLIADGSEVLVNWKRNLIHV